MSSDSHPTLSPDARRRRVAFHAWHRGIRELDLILGRFCDSSLADLSDKDLGEFERLLEVPDQELYGWIVDPGGTPPHYESALLARIRAFPAHKASTGA